MQLSKPPFLSSFSTAFALMGLPQPLVSLWPCFIARQYSNMSQGPLKHRMIGLVSLLWLPFCVMLGFAVFPGTDRTAYPISCQPVAPDELVIDRSAAFRVFDALVIVFLSYPPNDLEIDRSAASVYSITVCYCPFTCVSYSGTLGTFLLLMSCDLRICLISFCFVFPMRRASCRPRVRS